MLNQKNINKAKKALTEDSCKWLRFEIRKEKSKVRIWTWASRQTQKRDIDVANIKVFLPYSFRKMKILLWHMSHCI